LENKYECHQHRDEKILIDQTMEHSDIIQVLKNKTLDETQHRNLEYDRHKP
jgi:hypothetical protein